MAIGNTISHGDFLESVPLISDPNVRISLYDKIVPLLDALPDSLKDVKTGADHASIRASAMLALTSIRRKETEVFNLIVPYLADKKTENEAMYALDRLPPASWPKEKLPKVAATLLVSIKETNLKFDSQTKFKDKINFVNEVASQLPAEQAGPIFKALEQYSFRTIKIGTLFEKMAFDKEVIVVQAGKPVEFVLENNDMMPHNFVLLRPGSLERVGQYSDEHTTDADFASRNYRT